MNNDDSVHQLLTLTPLTNANATLAASIIFPSILLFPPGVFSWYYYSLFPPGILADVRHVAVEKLIVLFIGVQTCIKLIEACPY